MTTLSNWQGQLQDPADLNRKFAGTYVLASLQGAPAQVVQVELVGGLGGGGIGVLCRNDKGNRVEAKLADFDIINSLPPSGVYSLKEEAVALVRRLPSRQWSEGLYHGNTLVMVNGAPLTPTRRGEIPFDIAKLLFATQVDYPLKEGLAMLKPTKSLRLNQHYWLKSEGRKNETIGLMRGSCRIGSWAMKNFFLSSNAKILKEELKDELGLHA